jgi:hypothetical protein
MPPPTVSVIVLLEILPGGAERGKLTSSVPEADPPVV